MLALLEAEIKVTTYHSQSDVIHLIWPCVNLAVIHTYIKNAKHKRSIITRQLSAATKKATDELDNQLMVRSESCEGIYLVIILWYHK